MLVKVGNDRGGFVVGQAAPDVVLRSRGRGSDRFVRDELLSLLESEIDKVPSLLVVHLHLNRTNRVPVGTVGLRPWRLAFLEGWLTSSGAGGEGGEPDEDRSPHFEGRLRRPTDDHEREQMRRKGARKRKQRGRKKRNRRHQGRE